MSNVLQYSQSVAHFPMIWEVFLCKQNKKTLNKGNGVTHP